jgi:hypothetical protein
MKKFWFKFVTLLIMLIAFSCDEPVTVVTNIVHVDGSVTRKIEMRNTKNIFDKSGLQVPFDSSWGVKDTIEVGIKGDTTWIKRAEKVFRNVDEINATYRNDSSTNGMFPRHASFSSKFRWFNTSYRYSEIVKGRMCGGYPLKDFLNDSELYYFFAPEDLKYSKLRGTDSLKYKMLADTIDKKTLDWNLKNLAAVWVKEFSELTAGKAGPELSAELPRTIEARFIKVIYDNQEKFDSIWATGFLQKKILGEENGVKFKREADSALSVAFNRIAIDYKNYSVRIVMPGKLIRTNGYIDSTRNLMWPVNADLFFSDDYEMWAESKTPNIWAWILSGFFLVFVASGIILKKM